VVDKIHRTQFIMLFKLHAVNLYGFHLLLLKVYLPKGLASKDLSIGIGSISIGTDTMVSVSVVSVSVPIPWYRYRYDLVSVPIPEFRKK